MPIARRVLGCLFVSMVVGVAPVVHAAELLDLNKASVEQLTALPGLGAERAKMIVRVREKNGPFKALEELLALPRLTGRQFEELKRLLYVSEDGRSHEPERVEQDSRKTLED